MDERPRKLHARNLRVGRHSEPGRAYVLTAVTRDRKPVFRSLYCGRVVVNAMRHIHDRGDVESLAFVVMPDHVHWMLRLLKDTGLQDVAKSLKGFSARKINGYLRRRGSIWQPGFHDRALRADEDLRSAARYIVANPIRAGLVADIANYPLWDAMWLRGRADDEIC